MATKIRLDAIKNEKMNIDALDLTVEDSEAEKAEKVFDSLKNSAKIIDAMDAEIKNTKKGLDVVTAEKDHLKGELETLKKTVADSKNENSEVIKSAVKNRIDLEICAAMAGISAEHRKADSKALKIEIIKTKFKDFNCDDKSDDYINARFDSAKELIEVENNGNASIADLLKETNKPKNDYANESPDYRAEFLKKCNEKFKK